MRRIVPSLLPTAALTAGLALSSATPASAAGPYCFGLPDEPLAYACVTVHEPTVPDPAITWGEPTQVGHVPAVCYGLGCTEEGPVSVSLPWVSGLGVPTLVEVYYAGVSTDIKDLLPGIRDVLDNPCVVLAMVDDRIACMMR